MLWRLIRRVRAVMTGVRLLEPKAGASVRRACELIVMMGFDPGLPSVSQAHVRTVTLHTRSPGSILHTSNKKPGVVPENNCGFISIDYGWDISTKVPC